MTDEEIRQTLEQIDPEGKIPQEKIEELIVAIKDKEKNPPKDGDPVPGMPGARYGVLEANLKAQLGVETDWRKKSAIAAKIISLNLD